MVADKDIIDEALERWRIALNAERENREQALDDKRFAKIGGKHQWPEKVYQQRIEEGRPCLTINRMLQFLKQVLNDQRMNKPSITIRPVDDQGDVQTARIYQGLIRNIEVASAAEKAYDVSFDDAVTMGFGFFRILTDYAHDTAFDQEIKIAPISNAFTVYLDPDDWYAPKYAFVEEMVDRKAFRERYGIDPKPVPEGGAGTSMEGWYDGDKVRVAEYWRTVTKRRKLLLLSDGSTVYEDAFDKDLAAQRGVVVLRERVADCQEVVQYMLTGQELVSEPTPWAGKYIPIIPVEGEVIDIEGQKHRQGLIRHAKDPQRMFNFWRTMATESVALAPKTPFVGAVGQFDTDADKWATANTQSHAYLQYDIVDGAPPPQRQPFVGVPAGALQEAMNASDDMKSVMGLYDASLGARSNETSGKAILARKQEGDVSTFNFVDNLTRSLEHAGRVLVDLIPKIYDTARVVRIIGPDDEPQTVAINRIFMGDGGKEQMHDLSVGKYDVVVKVGPSFTTQREEVVNAMLEFMRVYPAAAPVLGDMLAKQMDWPEAEKIAQRLGLLLPPPVLAGENPAIQQMQQQMQQMDQHARQAVGQLQQQVAQLQQALDVAQGKSEADAAKAQIDVVKVKIDGYNAETNRMKAEADLLQAKAAVPVAPEPAAPARKVKRIQMLAPGGQVYEGTIMEEDVPQEAPQEPAQELA